MSVGGWTDSGPFYEMAASESTRQIFVDRALIFLKTYPQFDGIDIDWEHPVSEACSPEVRRMRKTTSCCSMCFANRLGPEKLLTIAVSAEPSRHRSDRVRRTWPGSSTGST